MFTAMNPLVGRGSLVQAVPAALNFRQQATQAQQAPRSMGTVSLTQHNWRVPVLWLTNNSGRPSISDRGINPTRIRKHPRDGINEPNGPDGGCNRGEEDEHITDDSDPSFYDSWTTYQDPDDNHGGVSFHSAVTNHADVMPNMPWFALRFFLANQRADLN